jgi:cell division protein FtsI (penicillin-binding protein 3)
MLTLIAGRLVWLQGFQASAYAAQAVEQRTSTITLTAPRGQILDREGEALALSVDARAIYGEPRTISRARCTPTAERPCDPAGIAAKLAPVLDLPVDEIERKLVLSPKATGAVCGEDDLIGCKGFAYLARGLEADHAQQVRDLGLVGIGIVAEPRRVHPGKDLAANVVGFTTVEHTGAAGIEQRFDEVLAGTNGKTVAEVDGGGRIIPNGRSTTVEPQAGGDVQLTIDRDLQWNAQKVLTDKLAEAKAESGSATIIDVRTGEVLALASVPTFDAEDPGEADASVRGNRAVTDVFEPGSIGKVITAAAALEEGVLTPDSVMSVADNIQVANKRFTDSHSHPVEQMTFTGVLVESSNVGTIMAAQEVGGPKLYEMLQRFGIGERTGIELPAESPGILRDEKDEWSKTDYGTHPIGQGYSVNGVQMASVYATVANGGVRVQPSIVKTTTGPDGEVDARPAPKTTRVLSQDVADQLRGMLEGVTNEGGTAVTAAIPGYRVAGKTGTARRVVDGRYDGSYTASFVGFAPADAPRLAIAVSVQAPKNGYYGGAVAGPVFRDIMSFSLRSLAIPPTGAPSPVLKLRAE